MPNETEFTNVFEPGNVRSFLDGPEPPLDQIKDVLKRSSLAMSEIAMLLLASQNPESRQLIMERAARSRTDIWQNRFFLMPPLYISNGDPEKGGCRDHYCN